MGNKTGKELMEDFTRIIYDSERLKKELNLETVNTNMGWGIRYNFDFFTRWCNHPFYIQIMNSILHVVHQQWQQKPNNTADEWVRIFQNFMEKNGLRRLD